jgi:hypothetical protein
MRTSRRTVGGAVLVACAVGAAVVARPAAAQISGQQLRQRYEKNTKGANISDYTRRLQSEDADTRLEAVKSLGASKDKQAIEQLIRALGDTDVRVQAKAIDMLGEMRANEATPVLIQYLFLRTTEPQMKQRILASLGKIGDPRAAQPIVEFLHRDLDPATRGTAIYALGDIGSSDAVQPLSEISVTDGDPTARRLASEALGKVQAQQASQKKEAKGPSEAFLAPKEPPGQGGDEQP